MSENTNLDLDLSFLYEIADGSNEFIVESISMFLQQTPELLQATSDAISANDWATAASTAHKLKPNLGFFGMLASQALIQDIETSCKAGVSEPTEVTGKFNNVKQIIGDSLIELEKIKLEKEAEI